MFTLTIFATLKKLGFTHPKYKRPDWTDVTAWVVKSPTVVPHEDKL